MATAVTISIAKPEGDSSWRIALDEDFDTVWGRIYPINAPASALEDRANHLFHTDGKPIMIRPNAVVVIEGDYEE